MLPPSKGLDIEETETLERKSINSRKKSEYEVLSRSVSITSHS